MDTIGGKRPVLLEGRGTADVWMSFAIGFQLGNDYPPPRVTVFTSFVIDVSEPFFRPALSACYRIGGRFVATAAALVISNNRAEQLPCRGMIEFSIVP